MALDILRERGVPLDRQVLTWKELEGAAGGALDAFTRVRVVLMGALERFAVRLGHALSWTDRALRLPLARIRRIESQQHALVAALLPTELSPLEVAIAYEQAAIEVTASVAQHEPDEYLAQVYRFGLLEDLDHLHAFAALRERLDGKDARDLLQGYTDVLPGRPTSAEHRAPEDDLRMPYDAARADPLSKIHALTITACELQTEEYYATTGPRFADPAARRLFAEIAAIEEQHVTQYGSLLDPDESPVEKLLLLQAAEVYSYFACAEQEPDPRVRPIWHRFVDWELGQLHAVIELLHSLEGRDAASVLPASLPEPIDFASHRVFVRETLAREVDLRARGAGFIDKSEERPGAPSPLYRQQLGG